MSFLKTLTLEFIFLETWLVSNLQGDLLARLPSTCYNLCEGIYALA